MLLCRDSVLGFLQRIHCIRLTYKRLCCSGRALPYASGPALAIFGYWTDWNPSSGWYATTGTRGRPCLHLDPYWAGNRQPRQHHDLAGPAARRFLTNRPCLRHITPKHSGDHRWRSEPHEGPGHDLPIRSLQHRSRHSGALPTSQSSAAVRDPRRNGTRRKRSSAWGAPTSDLQ